MGNVGNGTDYYRQVAEKMAEGVAGPGHEQLVRAIAEYHHGNESLHMHQDIERREPCSYCWLRAGRAMQIVGGHLLGGPLAEVHAERQHQDEKWGEQNHSDGTASTEMRVFAAEQHRRQCKEAAERGQVTWRHILLEEMHEAFAETDPAKLRAELVQVAAVTVAWIEAIDRRERPEAAT
ncbi:hypothetical protein [Nonomuraea angiospora]|uniref:hypothetical protein n=1 Tax=Nonomuraea angiospora TaxID=46172 RepID=UPI0029A50813|nr:hypothetical protein [Nonomuraea angiospora]MDX3109689.1 hypothetical protein [Nonomuraea angiospora]